MEGERKRQQDEEIDEEELEDILDNHVLNHLPEVVNDANASGEWDGVEPAYAHRHREDVVHVGVAQLVEEDPDDDQDGVDDAEDNG